VPARAAHGDAFVFGFGPIRFHWLVGREPPTASCLLDAADAFRNARRLPASCEPIGGPTALIVSDEPEHLRRRRSVQPAFHPRLVDAWAEAAAARFERFVDERLAARGGPLLPALRPVVLEIVLDVLLGPSARSRHPRLADDVATMMAFANQPLLAQMIKLPLPPAPWARFVAARRRADAALRADIRERRAATALSEGAGRGEGARSEQAACWICCWRSTATPTPASPRTSCATRR
jgi:cytochrome P450